MTVPENSKPVRKYSESDLLPRATRRHKRARRDRGLPTDGELRNLAAAYLNEQRTLWPNLADTALLPAMCDAVRDRMVADFKSRHRGGEVEPVDARLKTQTTGGCYVRYSSDNSSPTSNVDQMVNCLRKAESEGRFIPWSYVFADYGVTGMDASRQGYSAYKAALQSKLHQLETTYIDDFTRASRDMHEWWKLVSILGRHKKRLIGVSDSFDVTAENADILVMVFGVISKLFIKSTRQKVLRGMKSTAEGPGSLGKPPLGYTRCVRRNADGSVVLRPDGQPRKQICIDPVTSAYVKEIFDLFVNKQWSPYRIARHFNQRKVDNCDSWTDGGIRKILRNAKYVGEFVWNKFRREFNFETEKHERIPNPESEWRRFVDPSLAIIGKELWDAAQNRLDELKRGSRDAGKPKSRNENCATTLFSGTLFCKYCGKELTLARSTSKYKMMGCLNGARAIHGCELSTSKSTTIIENCLLGYIRETLITEQAIEDLVAKANEYLAEEARKPKVETRGLEQRERDLKKKINNVLEQVETCDDSSVRAVYNDRIRQLQHELDAVQTEIAAARSHNADPPSPLDANRLKSYVGDLRDLLNGEIPAAAVVLRKITGPIKIRHERHAGKQGARWFAEFQPNLTDGLLQLALERGCPDSSTLELLSKRIWINSETVEVPIDKVPKYEQLAPEFERMHKNGASIATIASANKMSRAYASRILKVAETGERPKWGSKKKHAVSESSPKESPRQFKYVELASEVIRRHETEGESFEQIAAELKTSYETVIRAWDSAHPDEVQAAAANGTTPDRRPTRKLPVEKIQRMRRLIIDGTLSVKDIADTVGVGQNTVRRERARMQNENEEEAA